ncbi:translation initiation factor IF-6 [Candidatus Woesearchaeota archaeon]|nr:translation initiation factor IF-6 [Candidatus Woesearchaeota archaeon]
MHVIKTSYNGDPNIGLMVFANDKFCLVGSLATDKLVKELHQVFQVPVHRITLCGTDLIGVFCVGNNHMILLPSIVFDYELEILDELKIKYTIIDSRLTALGNDILCNETVAYVNPEFSDEARKTIKKALHVELKEGTIAELENVGSLAVISKNKMVVHSDATDEEIELLGKIFSAEITKGSVNFGSPYIRSGSVANKHGFAIGKLSTGIEIATMDEGLGFL